MKNKIPGLKSVSCRGKTETTSFLYTADDSPPVTQKGGKVNLFKNGELTVDWSKDSVYVPLFFVKGKYPGSYSNEYSFNFNYQKNDTYKVLVRNMFEFELGFKNSKNEHIRTRNNCLNVTGDLKPLETGDWDDNSLESKIKNGFNKKINHLPVDILCFYNNFKMISAIARIVETDLDMTPITESQNTILAPREEILSLTDNDNYLKFNIFGLTDAFHKNYKNIFFDADPLLPTSYVTTSKFIRVGSYAKLAGGHDGTIHRKDVFKEYLSSFLDLENNPTLMDESRYPFTHIFDAGYDFSNKLDLIDFISTRQDVIAELTSYQSPEYSDFKFGSDMVFQDFALCKSLISYAKLTKESIAKGTEALRVNVYCSAGYLASSKRYFGLTYEVCDKLSSIDNGSVLKSDIAGLEVSKLNFLSNFLWLPSGDAIKEILWKEGINYPAYADHRTLFLPYWRSIMLNDTSNLIDANLVRIILYIKHIVRYIWSKFSGVKSSKNFLQASLKKDVDEALTKFLNNKLNFETSIYQNPTDQLLGYVHRVRITLYTRKGLRVAIFDTACQREEE